MVSHSLYADDRIIFLKSNYRNACNLRQILDKFARWSGQVVTDGKCTLLTSSNLGRSFTMGMARALRVQVANHPGKYLGIPLQWGRISEKTYSELLEKLSNRMAGWKSKSLNIAGRSVLIKSVLDPVSNHVMSMLKLPKGLINKIDKFRKKILWGGDKDARKMHNVNWQTVCSPVISGGLGLRDMDLNNLALLAKMAWRISEDQNSKVASLLKAKYFKDGDFWSSSTKCGCSASWRSLVKGKEIIKGSLRWCVGDGSKVGFWKDTWNNDIPLAAIANMNDVNIPSRTVKDVINSDTRQWDLETVDQFISDEVKRQINSIAIPVSDGRIDTRIWAQGRDGKVSVKEAYNFLISRKVGTNNTNVNWKFLWGNKCPQKIKFFLWKLCHNKLNLNESLYRKGISSTPGCSFCNRDFETVFHLFFNCSSVSPIWNKLHDLTGSRIDLDVISPNYLKQLRSMDVSVGSIRWCYIVPHVLWSILNSRNRLIHET